MPTILVGISVGIALLVVADIRNGRRGNRQINDRLAIGAES